MHGQRVRPVPSFACLASEWDKVAQTVHRQSVLDPRPCVPRRGGLRSMRRLLDFSYPIQAQLGPKGRDVRGYGTESLGDLKVIFSVLGFRRRGGGIPIRAPLGLLVGLIIAGPAEPLIAIQALLSKFLMCSRHRWTRTDALA